MKNVKPKRDYVSIFSGGRIEIRKEGNLLLKAVDRMPVPIQYIKFGIFNGSNLGYFYNCGNQDEPETHQNMESTTPADTIDDKIVVHAASFYNFGNVLRPFGSSYLMVGVILVAILG